MNKMSEVLLDTIFSVIFVECKNALFIINQITLNLNHEFKIKR